MARFEEGQYLCKALYGEDGDPLSEAFQTVSPESSRRAGVGGIMLQNAESQPAS